MSQPSDAGPQTEALPLSDAGDADEKTLVPLKIEDWLTVIIMAALALITFVNVLVPCVLFWKIDPGDQVSICKLAADSRFWPVYEVENGKYSLSYEPKQPVPLEKFLRAQGRFSHLFKKGRERMDLVEAAQQDVDEDWRKLLEKCGRAQPQQ